MGWRWRQIDRPDPRLDPYWGWARATGFRHLLKERRRSSGGDQPANFLRLVARVSTGDFGRMLAEFQHAGIMTTATQADLTELPFLSLTLCVESPVDLAQLDRQLDVVKRYCDRIELTSPIVVNELSPEMRLQPMRSQSDVVVAMIDDACPFAHPAWRGRVLALWQQGGEVAPKVDTTTFGEPSQLGYGIEFHRDYAAPPPRPMSITEAINLPKYQIGTGVDEAALYADAGFQILAHRDSHGAHVLDLLAGRVPLSRRRMPNPMQAPDWQSKADNATGADIIGVQLPREAIEDTSGRWLTDKVIDSLRFIMRQIGPTTKRVVVNVSYGPTTGPHDGSGLLEQALDAWCSFYDGSTHKPALEVVLPAGNSFQWQSHAAATLQKNQSTQLVWRVVNDGYRPSFLEVWFTDDTLPAAVEISVSTPGGFKSPNFGPGVYLLLDANGETVGVAALLDLAGWTPMKTKLVFLLCLEPTATDRGHSTPAPAGDWRIDIANRGNAAIDFHAYAQRGSTHMHFRRRTDTMSWFVSPDYDPDAYLRRREDDPTPPAAPLVRRRGTISGVATGHETRVATGYRLSDGKHVVYASAGPTRDGRPRLGGALPIDETRALTGVRAAGNLGASIVRLVGTSLAAPLLARHLANFPVVAPKRPVPPTPAGRDDALIGPEDFPPP